MKKGVAGDVTSTVGAAFMREIERRARARHPIWEHKVYVSPPLVVDRDGPIRDLPAVGEAVLLGAARELGA